MPVEIKGAETIEEFTATLQLLIELKGGDASDMTADEIISAYSLAIENGYRHFAIYQEGQIIGTFGLSMRYDPTFFVPGCELTNFIIAEQHRSKGIGHIAILFIEAYAKEHGAGFVRLNAYIDNYRNMAFYAHCGYKHSANYMYHILDR